MAGKGHEDAFAWPRTNGRCQFSQGSFAGTRGNRRCLSELVEPCAETTWRARTEFLRGGTNSSNPSPSSEESRTNYPAARNGSLFCRNVTTCDVALHEVWCIAGA